MKPHLHLLLWGLLLLASPRLLAQSNAPSSLTGTAVAYNQVNLTWKDNATNETKFEIERNDFASFTKIGEVSANTTSYQDKSVQGGGSYTYRVRAVLATGANTTYSNEVTVRTPATPPTTPTSLTASALSTSSIRLTWENPGGGTATDFLLERGSSAGGTFSQVAVVAYSRSPTFDDTGLSAGTQYCYRVRARGAGGTSGYSNVICASTPNPPLTAPQNLVATAASGTQINLSWNGVSGAGSYFVERSPNGNDSWNQIGNVTGGTTYADPNLTPNTQYFYRVRAYQSGTTVVSGPYSNVANARTPDVAPNAPARLGLAVKSDTQIDLQWADLSNNETAFEVQRSTDGGASWTSLPNAGANQTTYSSTGLTASTRYCFRVRAINGVGASAYAGPECATTNAPPITLPGAPTELTLQVVSDRQITLRWKDNSTNETGFVIERSTDGKRTWQRHKDVGQNTTSYDDGGMTASTQYCYRVYAYNTAGNSRTTNEECATTQAPPATAPNKPTNLVAAAQSSTDIKLTWQHDGASLTRFELQRSTTGNDPWESVDANITASSREKTDGSRTPSTRYYYRIRAVLVTAAGAALNSDWSNTADATTQAPPVTVPRQPTNLKAEAQSSTAIRLTWTDNSDNETGFAVERSTDGKRTWQRYKDLGPNTVSYDDGGLAASTQYCYRVLAFNTAGASATSNEECATTQAPPAPSPTRPTDLVAATQSSTEIKLTWKHDGANSTRFELQRSPNGNDSWENVDAAIPATSREKTDGGRTPSTRYYYRVRAVLVTAAGATLNSDWSNTADATTQAPPVTVPQPPTGLGATAVSSSQINLKWTASTSTFGTGYIVEQASPQGGSYKVVAEVNGVATTTFSVTGLSASTQYCYRLRTKYTTNSDVSNEICVTTQAPPVTVPRPPSNLNVTAASPSQINLSWTDNSDNESGFEVWWAASQTAQFAKLTDVPANQTTYSQSGLSGSAQYCYQVRAVNSAGQSTFAGPLCATTPVAPPAAPANLTATALSPTQIRLDWADRSTNESVFQIEHSTDGTSFTYLADAPANQPTYTHSGLQPNTRHYYRVRAANGGGVSDWTPSANALTPALPVPGTTADLKAELVDYDRVKLTWGAITNNPTTVFIERSTSPTTGFQQVGQVAGTATTYLDQSLAEKTTYYYRIRATNANGSSGTSNVVSIATPDAIIAVRALPLPEGMYAHVDNQTLNVTLNWSQFQEVDLMLVSMTGRAVLTDHCRINGGTRFPYSVAHLPAGLYILSIDTDQHRYTKKIWIP